MSLLHLREGANGAGLKGEDNKLHGAIAAYVAPTMKGPS